MWSPTRQNNWAGTEAALGEVAPVGTAASHSPALVSAVCGSELHKMWFGLSGGTVWMGLQDVEGRQGSGCLCCVQRGKVHLKWRDSLVLLKPRRVM